MNNLEEILNLLNSKQNVFLTGGAGVGKTTMVLDIIQSFEDDAKKVAKLASTGMASSHIGGQTLHSFFDIGICNSIDDLKQNTKEIARLKIKKLISSMSLIIIDEISMVSVSLLEVIWHRLTESNYRGVLLFVGDFLQLPPISKGDIFFAFESKLWAMLRFTKIELHHIYRTDDVVFINLLNHVRFGFINHEIHEQLNSYIKPLPEDLSLFTFLFGKNTSSDMHNKKQLNFLDGDVVVKQAQIIKHKKNTKELEIQRYMKDSRIDEFLELKVGAPVLFTRNSWNYFNGERGMVIKIDNEYVYVKKLNSKIVKLEVVAQSKNRWVEKSVNKKREIVEEAIFSIYQFPIKLAFSITIHKSQGMSIEDLIIETNEIFAPSQFYVALSRSSNPSRLNLIAPHKQWRELLFVNKKAIDFVINDTIIKLF